MTLVLAAAGGFLPVLVVTLIIIITLVVRSRRDDPELGQRTSAVVLDTRSGRRDIGPTGLVGYQALVRFATSDGRTVQGWIPSARPPGKWRIPGQQVVVAYSADDPARAYVQRRL